MKIFTTILILVLSLLAIKAAENKTSVGLGIVIKGVEISGSKVIPIPRTDHKTPIVLRVVKAEKTADGYSYDIHAEGLDPGNYDLAKYLKREDNSPLETKAIPFEVFSQFEHPLTEPEKLTTTKPNKIGGYTTLLWLLGITWTIGLLAIIFYKKRSHLAEEPVTPPLTLTEKITALIKGDKNDTENKAKLERLLIGHWMEKFPDLKDKNKPISESLTFLRNHPESSPMILNVERWLHSGKEVTEEEIESTLAPYSEPKQKELQE